MARVPIIEIAGLLVVTVQEELHDRDALRLQEELTDRLERTGSRGVLLDLSGVETVDSFLGRLLTEIAQGARLMGAHTVVVGIQPSVAITLVELGLELQGISTALNAARGLSRLRHLLAAEGGRGRT